MLRTLAAQSDAFPLTQPFRISRGVKTVAFRDWQRIEAAEAARAREGSPREKFVAIEEMLRALQE